jgi:hypothetical protein
MVTNGDRETTSTTVLENNRPVRSTEDPECASPHHCYDSRISNPTDPGAGSGSYTEVHYKHNSIVVLTCMACRVLDVRAWPVGPCE